MHLGNPNLPKNWITTWIFGKPRQRWPKVKAKSTPNPRPGQERPPHDFVPVQKLLVAWSQLTATHDVWWSQFIAILAHSWQILDIPADKSSDFINSSNSLVNISFFNRWSHCHFVIFSTDLMDPLVFHISSEILSTPSCCHWNIVARSSSVLCCRRSSAFSCLALATQKIGSTLQEINISHLGKRKIIFKMPFLGDMLVPCRVHVTCGKNKKASSRIWSLVKIIPFK